MKSLTFDSRKNGTDLIYHYNPKSSGHDPAHKGFQRNNHSWGEGGGEESVEWPNARLTLWMLTLARILNGHIKYSAQDAARWGPLMRGNPWEHLLTWPNNGGSQASILLG